MKKLLIAVIFVLVLSSVGGPQVGAAEKFKDVPSTHYAYEEITSLVSDGVIKGFSDNTFRPSKIVTRGEFATLVARSLNLPEADSSFKDVKRDSPLYDGISRAAKAGIIRGFSDGTFKGYLPVSREDMAVMIDRALQLKGNYTKTKILDYSDISQIGYYSKKSVERMSFYGVMGADSGNRFNGKASGDRAETARVIYRMLSVIDTGLPYGSDNPPVPSTDIETIKKKDPFALTHAEVVKAYGPYVITRRNDIFGKVRGIEQWDYWTHYFDYLENAKTYKYPKVMRPDEWLHRKKTEGTLSVVYGEVDFSYPDYEIIALNGVPFQQSELINFGSNRLIYNDYIDKYGDLIPTPPSNGGQFKIDLHINKKDFVTYFKNNVEVGEQSTLPYVKDNKSLMVDMKALFSGVGRHVKVSANSLTYGDKVLSFTNGVQSVKVNGEIVELSVAPEMKSGVQMMPLIETSELIGLETNVVKFGKVNRIEILNY